MSKEKQQFTCKATALLDRIPRDSINLGNGNGWGRGNEIYIGNKLLVDLIDGDGAGRAGGSGVVDYQGFDSF